MMRLRVCLIIAGALGMLPTILGAVTLSASGSGQVLLFPYYTVNANQQTLLSVVNDSDQPKALKLRFREGVRGRALLSLDVYLQPFDTWTGTVFKSGSYPALLSDDGSCTVPDLHAETLPQLPDGRRYMDFPPAQPDPPLPPIQNGLEGSVEVIEMGELTGDSAAATRQDQGDDAPADCPSLVAAWGDQGYWTEAPATDIQAPGGGLSGSASVVDVGQGKVLAFPATALAGFRVAAMNTAPQDEHPNLGDALSDAGTGIASAYVPVGNTVVQSDYPPERAVDAVSAALMAETLSADFNFSESLGAATDFVLNMPTKAFYVDASQYTAPFGRDTFHYQSELNTLCSLVGGRVVPRSGALPAAFSSTPPEEPSTPKPCYAVSLLAEQRNDVSAVLGSRLLSMPPLMLQDLESGRATLAMNLYDPRCVDPENCDDAEYNQAHINIMRPDLAGRQWIGLPVIGFAATRYINAHAGGEGVLANYSYTLPFQRGVLCKRDGAVGDCP